MTTDTSPYRTEQEEEIVSKLIDEIRYELGARGLPCDMDLSRTKPYKDIYRLANALRVSYNEAFDLLNKLDIHEPEHLSFSEGLWWAAKIVIYLEITVERVNPR